jgi:predicted nucleotidyltransferase
VRVKKVIVYGSQASGRYRKDSDIDVAVVSPDFGKNRTKEGINLFRIASLVDSRIEPVPVSEKSFYADTWVPLIYEIRSKGIEIAFQ